MDRRGPWIRHDSRVLLERCFFSVVSDQVTTPAGDGGDYDWIQCPDQVRVAARTDDGSVFITIQHHYLPNRPLWQLPGGNVDTGREDPATAAARELAEETGARADSWRRLGAPWPLPGLSSARVHLFAAEGLTFESAQPDDTESDLISTPVPLTAAVTAALDGTIACAGSALLVLALAASAEPNTTTHANSIRHHT